MAIINNGDPIRAIGFVALYSAYVEERLIELIELSKDSFALPITISNEKTSAQIKTLKKKYNIAFSKLPDYIGKSEDMYKVTEVLKAAEELAPQRDLYIHSANISDIQDNIYQKTKIKKIDRTMTCTQICEFADELRYLDACLHHLQFTINHVITQLKRNNIHLK